MRSHFFERTQKIQACTITAFVLISYSSLIPGQEIRVQPLIDIPGQNQNFDIAYDIYLFESMSSYICWENQDNDVFSINLQKIYPEIGERIVVYSDTSLNVLPCVSFVDENHLRIVWQQLYRKQWQLRSRDYINGQLNELIILTDSLANVQSDICHDRIVWIRDGYLVHIDRDSELTVIDGPGCSNPRLCPPENVLSNADIIYEKTDSISTQIYFARYVGQHRENPPYWEITIQTTDGRNINPSVGMFGSVAWQSWSDDVWKIAFPHPYNDYMVTTNNSTCNYENPYYFCYPIPTTSFYKVPIKGFFLAFDSDSTGEKDVYIKHPIGYWGSSGITNISNAQGADTKPQILLLTWLQYVDKDSVAIIWEHENDNTKEIWWGISPIEIIKGNVEDENQAGLPFAPSQNYPNPFNPTTTISFDLPKDGFVTLKIYDITGRLVRVLVQEQKPAGAHSMLWDGMNDGDQMVAAGVYLYQIEFTDTAGERMALTKKMSLVK